MVGDQIEQALARVEAALDRLEAAARAPRPSDPAADPMLAERHERLRTAVSQSLRQLDGLIEEHSR